MKNKILVGIAAGMFAVATVFSFNLSNANGAGNVSLDDIAVMAQAEGEIDGGELPGATVYGSRTYKSGGNGYVTITWIDIWFNDPYNPTEQEISNMERDLRMKRREAVSTAGSGGYSNTYGGSGGWNLGFDATVNYSHTRHSATNDVSRTCCGKDYVEYCTHLPPCEAYDNM